jgi:hypothetical protein
MPRAIRRIAVAVERAIATMARPMIRRMGITMGNVALSGDLAARAIATVASQAKPTATVMISLPFSGCLQQLDRVKPRPTMRPESPW